MTLACRDAAGWASCAAPIQRRWRAYSSPAKEGTIMDPHFNEYLAAIAGMHDIYGDRPENHPTDFHEDHACVVGEQPAATVAAA
jgi:hypothetical protein